MAAGVVHDCMRGQRVIGLSFVVVISIVRGDLLVEVVALVLSVAGLWRQRWL